MHNYRIFSSYKNILKTNPDSLPATAIKISMKYIKTQSLFVKKERNKQRKKERKRKEKERNERMEPSTELRSAWRTASASLVKRLLLNSRGELVPYMFIQYIYIHVSPPRAWLRQVTSNLRTLEPSTATLPLWRRILLFPEAQLPCLGNVAKDALGQVGLWMA